MARNVPHDTIKSGFSLQKFLWYCNYFPYAMVVFSISFFTIVTVDMKSKESRIRGFSSKQILIRSDVLVDS